jgi:hypothetical protein
MRWAQFTSERHSVWESSAGITEVFNEQINQQADLYSYRSAVNPVFRRLSTAVICGGFASGEIISKIYGQQDSGFVPAGEYPPGN